MKNLKRIGVLSSIIGMILYNIMGRYYGVSGQRLVAYVCISIGLFGVLLLILMKHFLVAFLLLALAVPLVIASIGMYLDNLLLLFGGLILLVIMIFVLLKTTPYLAKYKK